MKGIDALARGAVPGSPTGGPGCAVGVAVDGELCFAQGYGLANLEQDAPITAETVFDIGSTSKQFTAAAVLMLATDGLLGLDDPIRRHLTTLPESPFGPITVRHLLHHTSGIPDYLGLVVQSGHGLENDYPEDQIVDLIARQEGLLFAPGTRFSYTSSGYFLLAEVVRAASGRSLREVCDHRIFKPLGMTRTFCHDDFTEVVRGRASAYGPTRDGAGYRIDYRRSMCWGMAPSSPPSATWPVGASSFSVARCRRGPTS